MKVRLLISGSLKNPNTIGAFITRHFDSSLEWEFLKFPDVYSNHLNSLFYKIVNRIFPVLLVRKMDRLFLQQVVDFKPTVIVIFKGMEISSWSLQRIRKMGIKLVNYNFDHPFDFFSKGTGNPFVKDAIPFYDLHISYSERIAHELRVKFKVPAACIPFGFHLTEAQYNAVIQEDRGEMNRVCFVGNPDEHRIKTLAKLLADGIPIDVYGFGWEKHVQELRGLTIHPPRKPGSFWVDPNEFWKVLRQYRVQLNFFRPHNEGSHNLRTFEVPAVGGILLTPESEEQSRFFEVNEEIFCYTDYTSLLSQCKKLLTLDKQQIDAARLRARLRSISSDYSYQRRTKDLLNLLNTLTTDYTTDYVSIK